MVQNNLLDNIDIVVVIDKEKLPEDVRKMIEENLPKDVQDKVFEMLQKGKIGNIVSLQNDKDNKSDKDNRLFAIQTGTVVGNIYTDDIYKKEDEQDIKKKKEIKEGLEQQKLSLGGCY